jgi:hypothetical protein
LPTAGRQDERSEETRNKVKGALIAILQIACGHCHPASTRSGVAIRQLSESAERSAKKICATQVVEVDVAASHESATAVGSIRR